MKEFLGSGAKTATREIACQWPFASSFALYVTLMYVVHITSKRHSSADDTAGTYAEDVSAASPKSRLRLFSDNLQGKASLPSFFARSADRPRDSMKV